MTVRIDTTNIHCELGFSLKLYASSRPDLTLYALNATTKEIEMISYTMSEGVDDLYSIKAVAPSYSGYLLGKVAGRSVIVKKIGKPKQLFVVAHKEALSIPYHLYNEDGLLTSSGLLKHIVDGFYYTDVVMASDVMVIYTLGRRFFIAKERLFELDSSLGDVELPTINLPSYILDSSLGDAVLANVELESIELASIDFDVIIRGRV